MSSSGDRHRSPFARFYRRGHYDMSTNAKLDDDGALVCRGTDDENDGEEDGAVEVGNVDAGGGTFTVDEALQHIGFGRYQLLLSVLCGMIWMADSMEMMMLSILGPEARCAFGLKSWEEAFITTVVFIGSLISATLWGWFVDQYGRRRGMFVQIVFLTYFGFLSSLSTSYGWLLFLRFLVGVGLGGAPIATVFYSEFLSTKSRSNAINFLNVWWSVGTCLEVGLAYAIMPTLGWHYLLAISPVVFIFVIIMFPFVYQSPRHLLLIGKAKKAREVLEKIARMNRKSLPPGRLVSDKEKETAVNATTPSPPESDVDRETSENELSRLTAKSVDVKNERAKFADLFRAGMWKTTLMTISLWFVAAFTYYGVVLLTTEIQEIYHGIGKANNVSSCTDHVSESANTTECNRLTDEDYRRTLYTTFAEFPGLVLSGLLCHFFPRKISIAVCFGGMALFYGGTLFCMASENFIIAMLFGVRVFATAVFIIIVIITPEIYPTSIRAIAMGTCSSTSRIGAIVTPFIAQWFLRQSIIGTKIIYVSSCVIAAILALLHPVETKGRPMRDTVSAM